MTVEHEWNFTDADYELKCPWFDGGGPSIWKDYSLLIMAPSKYPQELRDRAVRLAIDARRHPATRTGAITRIAEQTGVGKETLRSWVRKAELSDIPAEPVDSSSDSALGS